MISIFLNFCHVLRVKAKLKSADLQISASRSEQMEVYPEERCGIAQYSSTGKVNLILIIKIGLPFSTSIILRTVRLSILALTHQMH